MCVTVWWYVNKRLKVSIDRASYVFIFTLNDVTKPCVSETATEMIAKSIRLFFQKGQTYFLVKGYIF